MDTHRLECVEFKTYSVYREFFLRFFTRKSEKIQNSGFRSFSQPCNPSPNEPVKGNVPPVKVKCGSKTLIFEIDFSLLERVNNSKFGNDSQPLHRRETRYAMHADAGAGYLLAPSHTERHAVACECVGVWAIHETVDWTTTRGRA